MTLYVREWGRGEAVIALHPLGLDSSAFAGLGATLASLGLRTIAVDLPGFGRSPSPAAPLTPARLAQPVVRMARGASSPPVLLGISMGGRVALEAALSAPQQFRALILVAPYLPWRRFRWALALARWMSPWAAERVPVELGWPALKRIAEGLEKLPLLRDDDLARAGVRLIYNSSCPATRGAIVSAAREMALDPAFGASGLWDRLPQLARIRTAFLWGGHDWLVPPGSHRDVERALPNAEQRLLPCLSHALNGAHHRCLAFAVARLLGGPLGATPSGCPPPCPARRLAGASPEDGRIGSEEALP